MHEKVKQMRPKWTKCSRCMFFPPAMFAEKITGYVYHSISYETQFNNPVSNEKEMVNFVDVYFVNIDSKLGSITDEVKLNEYIANNCLWCIRFYNFFSSFYVVKLPGMSKTQFRDFILDYTSRRKHVQVKFKTTFRKKPFIESSFFNFGNKTLYAKIKSKSSSELRSCHAFLKKKIQEYYTEIRDGHIELNGWDKMFYEHTESPFRNDMTTLSADKIRYYLSTKYSIPCVGGFHFVYNPSQVKFVDDFPINEFPGFKHMSFIKRPSGKEYTTMFVNMEEHNAMFHQFTVDESINGQEHLTIMSYDIETYESSLRTLEESEKIIMCIGIGLFNLTNERPFLRYCLSVKDITEHDKEILGDKLLSEKSIGSTKEYVVRGEYSEDTHSSTDTTIYQIFSSESSMFKSFVKIIHRHRPTFICGFNNYGFDDRRMFDRMKYYGVDEFMNGILQYYDLNGVTGNKSALNGLVVDQSKFQIKIDGNEYNDNITWIGETKSFMVDVYKVMLANNPKLYTQQGRGNLDTMLAVNGIKNPFNGKDLSKSGLSYAKMWHNWDTNENIYDILLYCCQDAWICGTLLIKSCQLIDKIEMSSLSATTIPDSIFKAVTWRVKHVIERYAWANNFAVCDSIISKTSNGARVSRADNHDLGNKYFDVRQIVGGEVKNVISGRQQYVIALDFSAMYPSQKEGSNIDTSSTIPDDVVNDPGAFGLKKYHDDVFINDMYKERRVMYLENSKGERFTIEQFSSVFKNNIAEITKVINAMVIDAETGAGKRQYLVDMLKPMLPNQWQEIETEIYDNGTQTNEIVSRLSDTETRYLFTVQSPRDPSTNKVTEHYSLKEIMLSDLRSLRGKVKKQMEEATNSIDKSRFNSKQLAIKVMCNSEYGASNSSYFPYYDTLIGGATTAASRCLINFLTNVIQTDALFVDQRFIDKNIDGMNMLKEYGVLSWKQIVPEKDFAKHRRFALRRLFNDYYEVITNDVFELNISPSAVVYQDTDSNYYTNDYIKKLFGPLDHDRVPHLKSLYQFLMKECPWSVSEKTVDEYVSHIISLGDDYENPQMVNLKMNLLLCHNKLVGCFIEESILRKPVSVGFEGAFITVRYFNVKKKYYGVVWNDRMGYALDKSCYENGVLERNFPWSPSKTSFPQDNGDFIMIDEQKLMDTSTDKLAFIKKQNIKLTGVDLARRDQYKFININHIRLIRQDLHFLKYLGENTWKNITNINMLDIVLDLLQQFRQQFVHVNTVVENMLNNMDGDYDVSSVYSLRDFAKDITFKYVKSNFLVFKTRIYTGTDKLDHYERYPITDLAEELPNGNHKSTCATYTTESGTVVFTLERDVDGNYVRIFTSSFSCDIPDKYQGVFYVQRPNSETVKDACFIDYDNVLWSKQSKVLHTIGTRMYKTIQNIKDTTHARISDKTFSEHFPSGFSRKQYVLMLTEETKIDRLKGVKTESVKNSDKAFLIKELHHDYRQKLSEADYCKLQFHDRIPYKRFIDLMIINDLDNIHYTEAFASAISLYLIEYARQILSKDDYDKVKSVLPKENNMLDSDEDPSPNVHVGKSVATISNIKQLITWELLLKIYPDRIRSKKPRIARLRGVDEKLYKNDLSQDEYKKLLMTNDEEAINLYNSQLNNNRMIFIVEDWEMEDLKEYEDEYNRNSSFKNAIKQYYKTYCGVTEEIPFRTVVERANIILNAVVNSFKKYGRKKSSLERLEEYYDLNMTVDKVTFKSITCNIDRSYYDRLFDPSLTVVQHKQAMKKEFAKITKTMTVFSNITVFLQGIIDVMNSH